MYLPRPNQGQRHHQFHTLTKNEVVHHGESHECGKYAGCLHRQRVATVQVLRSAHRQEAGLLDCETRTERRVIVGLVLGLQLSDFEASLEEEDQSRQETGNTVLQGRDRGTHQDSQDLLRKGQDDSGELQQL